MFLLRPSVVLVLCVVALSACSSGAGDLCTNVVCGSGRTCDPTSGACLRNDSGTTVVDSGTVDAGTPDAGTPDAGTPDAGPVNQCFDCGATGKVCDPSTLTCVQCVSDSQCSCPNALCSLNTHTCVAPTTTPTTGGESCAAPQAINFSICSPKSTTFQVDLSKRTNDEAGSCSTAGGLGNDAVYQLRVPALSDVKVTTSTPAGSTAQAVVYLRADTCAAASEIACKDTLGAKTGFRAKSLAAGFYTLIIDAFDKSTSGLVDVTVELLAPVTNDTCATPLTAPIDGGSVSVDLAGAKDDYKGTCNTTSIDSRDTVFKVTLDQRSTFDAVATALVPDSGVDPVLYLRADPCATGAQLACFDTQGDVETLHAGPFDAGTYYLVVEGYGTAGSGPVSLTSWVTTVPAPPNDTCATPRVLDFTNTDSLSFTADTSTADDNTIGSCPGQTAGGRDLVYTFTLAAPRTVTVTSAAVDPTSGVDPIIYLRQGSCAGPELQCEDAYLQPEEIIRALPAGTYFLFVDAYQSKGAGPTAVTVNLSP